MIRHVINRVLAGCALACGLLVASLSYAVEHAAQVVALQGKGESKDFDAKSWSKLVVQDKLHPGDFVRTGDMSSMALVFRDQTQVKLNQNSQLQIKTVADASDANLQTAMKLNAGRAWAQTKNVSGKLSMQTPTATMSIRGTDWDVEVAEDGTSTLTVLSGSIEFFNDFGSVTVNKGEQAVATQGKAPVKLLISNPKERVQWVTSYEVDPLRHIRLSGEQGVAALQAAASQPGSAGAAALYDLRRYAEAKTAFAQALASNAHDSLALAGLALLALNDKNSDAAVTYVQQLKSGELAALVQSAYLVRSGELRQAQSLLQKLLETPLSQPATALILADFLAYQGKLEEAIAADRDTLAMFPNSPHVNAHLARLQVLADQEHESAVSVAAALSGGADAIEPYLAQGEVARWNGETKAAESGFGQAIKLNPADDRGWFGLGAVLNDKEDARRSRGNLEQAVTLNPDGPGYEGELGTLETFANRFAAAQTHFDRALERNPEDYVALTGYGVMLLKRGQTDAALEQFLKASVIEPRYARAHLYTAIAYYQLGRTQRALEELAKARELDSRDPLPAMIASMIHTDQFDAASAVQESRTANELMPYLKSMNQLANNQRGAANVGNALAFWGLADWARHYAQDSYYPYWAGSHLFLSDLYDGRFAKSSELFQGYLTDPTVFGASNRFQTLIHKPGHYQSYSLTVARDHDVMEHIPKVTFNGYLNEYVPIAYFLDVEDKLADSRGGAGFGYNDDTRSFTAALGMMPTNELRLFAFFNRDYTDSHFRSDRVSHLNFDLQTGDFSLGGSYAFSPTSQLLVKYGENQLHGFQRYLDTRPSSNRLFDRELSHDFQVAWQGRVMDSLELIGGAEYAESPESSSFVMTSTGGGLLYDDRARLSERTQLGYGSGKWFFDPRSFVQLDAVYTDYFKSVNGGYINNLAGTAADVNQQFTQQRLSPRVGIAWNAGSGHTLRAAYQDWVRPSSSGTLGPVATAGIALDEDLLRFGGRLKRGVAKLESEWTPTFYTEVTLDHKESKNLGTYDLSLAESFANLTKVRQRTLLDVVNAQAGQSNPEYDNIRFNDTADLDQVRVAASKILTSTLSATASYLHTSSDVVLSDKHYYLPRHQVVLGASWVSPMRVRLNADINWRSSAHTFLDLNQPYGPYASSNLSAYWETLDKRWGVAGFVRDAFSPHDSTYYGFAASYRY